MEAYEIEPEIRPEDAAEELRRRARKEMLRRGRAVAWRPLPGPQTQALESDADETLYGGAAGGGKSDFLLGCAMTQHRNAIIFRREYPQLKGLTDRAKEIVDGAGQFNASDVTWRLDDGRVLEFGAVQHDKDKEKYRGRPHDFIGFDEAANFTEDLVVFLTGWLRTTIPGQRCRVAYATNPPTDTDGEWLIRRFAPWLDEKHARPAEPGELRWFVMLDGKDSEVDGPEPFEHNGETVHPRSRTFIPARVGDNPYLRDSGYVATLQAMPEPLRSQLLYGDFSVGLQDDDWQVIPSAWVRAAQERWTASPPALDTVTAIGVDIAQGGRDRTVLARRYGEWYAPLESHDGASVPDARANARLVKQALEHGGVALIDADGVGAATYHLVAAELGYQAAIGYRGSESAKKHGKPLKDKSGRLTFANVRAAAWWRFREALDPSSGRAIKLPPSRELRAELCAVRFSMQANGLKLEDKDDVKKRLGRSIDLADPVVMAWWFGAEPNGLAAWLDRPRGFTTTLGSGKQQRQQSADERLALLLGGRGRQ